jgi:hypothetical protein
MQGPLDNEEWEDLATQDATTQTDEPELMESPATEDRDYDYDLSEVGFWTAQIKLGA